jgi:hypothetical protein
MTAIGPGRARRQRATVAAVACLTLTACAPFGASRIPAGSPERLRFTNATPDHVTVYLTAEGTRPWRLGDVDGFRTSSLPLPFLDPRNNARLLVVPLGASRMGRAALGDLEDGAWSARSEPTDGILNMQWTLVGHQLFSVPPPSRPR